MKRLNNLFFPKPNLKDVVEEEVNNAEVGLLQAKISEAYARAMVQYHTDRLNILKGPDYACYQFRDRERTSVSGPTSTPSVLSN